LEQRETPLKAQFNRLLARPLDASVALPDSLFLPSQAPLSALNDSLFASHPRLAMITAEERVRIQEAEVMRLEGKPMFEVGATYMAIGKRTDMYVPESGRDVFMPMVGVSIPIYRKKYEAGIREAQRMQLASQHQRAEAESMLRTAFEMATFERKEAWEMYQTNKQQLSNTQKLIELQLSNYAHTGQGFERLLQLQQRLLIFQTGMLKATTAYFTAQARIDYLLD
jgi:outer membrane protein TolC